MCSDALHVVHVAHSRSRKLVAGSDTYCHDAQMVWVLQCLSDEAVGGTLSYWSVSSWHREFGLQTRSDVFVGAAVWCSAEVQTRLGLHTTPSRWKPSRQESHISVSCAVHAVPVLAAIPQPTPESAKAFVAFVTPYRPPFVEYSETDRKDMDSLGPNREDYIPNSMRLMHQVFEIDVNLQRQ